MATPVYATLADVQNGYERPIPADRAAWVTNLIDRATRRLNSLAPGIAGRIAAGTLDPDDVNDVVVSAVLRIVRNPDGYSSETEGNYSAQVRADVAGGALMFTADDLAQVRGRRTGPIGRPLTSTIPWTRAQP